MTRVHCSSLFLQLGGVGLLDWVDDHRAELFERDDGGLDELVGAGMDFRDFHFSVLTSESGTSAIATFPPYGRVPRPFRFPRRGNRSDRYRARSGDGA